MKQLKYYINENRVTVGKLPFTYEFFEKFMLDVQDEGNLDESVYYSQMEEKITSKYGYGVWRMFWGWSDSYYELKNNGVTIREMYDGLSKININIIKRGVGGGSSGMVIKLNEKWVMKIFFNHMMTEQDMIFAKYCYKKKSDIFPYISKIGKNWYVMEKLATNTKKTKLYSDTMDKSFGKERFWKLIYDHRSIEDMGIDMNKDELQIADWSFKVKNEMKKMHCPSIGWPGDLRENNLGERVDGTIIFFDI